MLPIQWLIKISAPVVWGLERIVNAVEPFDFDLIYGGWWDYLVLDAKSALKRSAERYIKAIS